MGHETLTAEEVNDLSASDAKMLNSVRLKDRARRAKKNIGMTANYQGVIEKHKARLVIDPGNKKSIAKIAACEEALRNIAVHRHPMGAYVEPTLNDANIDLY